MTKCPWIDTSVVIDSQGFIKPCCNMGGSALIDKMESTKDIHIENIDSINDNYFYNDFLLYLRKSLNENGIKETPECSFCNLQIQKKTISHWDRGKEIVGNFKADGQVKYLEVTTSNICNQTCVTCSPYFSSKWETIEHLFESVGGQGHTEYEKKHNMTDDDLKKIFSILPTLKILLLKGGEPFSDLRNLKILKELVIVNPTCRVWFTTNASIISNKFLDVLSKLKNISINASLDHIGKKYEWIRSTSFEQTLHTMQRIYEHTGQKCKASSTLSYFNILDIKEIADFYKQFEYVHWGQDETDLYRWNGVHWPREMDFHNTRTQEELDTLNLGLVSEFNPEMHKTLMNKIEIMNGIRGFKWQDC